MAVKTFTAERIAPNAVRIIWENLTSTGSDTGTPYVSYDDVIRTVQAIGTFGAGGNVQIEGSLEATAASFGTMHDTAGSDLDLGDDRIEQVQEGPCTYRPRVTGGDGTTDIDVIVIETLRARR